MTIKDLEVYRLTKEVQEQLGEDFAPKSTLEKGIQEAFERNQMKLQVMERKSEDLKEKGQNPYPCFNTVCSENVHETNTCGMGVLCHDCLFQMTSGPPNSLDYTANEGEKMPSHQEALDLLVEYGLLKDESWERKIEEIYLREEKKPATQYDRGLQEINGVTMDHLRVCILQILEEFYTTHKTLIGGYEFSPSCPDLDLSDEGDREILVRNICLNLEKVMGIYPNIKIVR